MERAAVHREGRDTFAYGDQKKGNERIMNLSIGPVEMSGMQIMLNFSRYERVGEALQNIGMLPLLLDMHVQKYSITFMSDTRLFHQSFKLL